MMKELLTIIKNDEQAMLALLERLVNIDSNQDNLSGIDECAHIVGDFLQTLGFTVEYLTTPGAATHMLAKIAGTGLREVMVMGHLDTVFKKGTAAARPFYIEGDKAFGPGVMDMKGGVVAGLFAVKALLATGYNGRMKVFFCGDEEPGHLETEAAALFMREGKNMDAVFNLEPGRPNGGVTIGRKGVIRPILTVEGVAAHSGNNPEQGISAILELAHKTIALEALTDFATGTTYNVGIVNGGSEVNIIPDCAVAKVDIRFKTAEAAAQAVADVERIAAHNYVAGTHTTISANEIQFMPMETTVGVEKLFAHVQQQASKLGLPPVPGVYAGGCSDAAWTTYVGAPTVCSMGPIGEAAHSNREFLVVHTLVERTQLLAACIKNL
ncbi:MAG: M20 family metallopeptidase [Acidaminococcaceae bacterium]